MDYIKLFSGGFPLSVERLQFLQNTYAKALSDLSKLAGTGLIIVEGVETVGTQISSGTVIINGEILPFQGGALFGTVRIQENTVNVPYNEDADGNGDLDLKAADTVRTAICSEGATNPNLGLAPSLVAGEYILANFVKIPTLIQLAPTVGTITMFYGDPANLPYWEKICDGENGTPNLIDRTPIGAGNLYTLGQEVGKKDHVLTNAEAPAHSHSGTVSIPSHRHAFNEPLTASIAGGADNNKFSNSNNSASKQVSYTDYAPAQTASLTTNQSGGGEAHNNIQPSTGLHYKMFIGY